MPFLQFYTAPVEKNWQGREDSLANERFFQCVKCIDLSKTTFIPSQGIAIIGFCCDTGVLRNLGRAGAKEGPLALRSALAKLANHQSGMIYDFGDIHCKNDDLESAQKALGELVTKLQFAGLITVVLGGGHETAWGHYQGLHQTYPQLGIINIDAHFDLRPLINHQGHSGSPFRQIHDHCQNQKQPFDYLCLGIQPLANTRSLFETAQAMNVKYLDAQTLYQQSVEQTLLFIQSFVDQCPALYLSLCLDVFNESVAPGVSAPQPLGLMPEQILPILKYILQTGKVKSIDIVELAPSLDINKKTSRLAAALLAEMLHLTS